MKKALVLGALAFFAINIATVQSVNAQADKTGTSVNSNKPKAVKPAALKPETNVTTKETQNAVTPAVSNQKNSNGAEAAPTGRAASNPANTSTSTTKPASPKSLKTTKPTSETPATATTPKEKDNTVKPGAASWDTEKGGSRSAATERPVRTKSNKKAEVKTSAQASSAQNNAGKEYNQSEKNKTPEIGVPPTPKTKKPGKTSSTPKTGTNK